MSEGEGHKQNHMLPENDLYGAWMASMEQPGQGLRDLIERSYPELQPPADLARRAVPAEREDH